MCVCVCLLHTRTEQHSECLAHSRGSTAPPAPPARPDATRTGHRGTQQCGPLPAASPSAPLTRAAASQAFRHEKDGIRFIVLKDHSELPDFAVYNMHFSAQIVEGEIRRRIIHGGT